MSERIVLDPSAVADADRTEIDLTDLDGPLHIHWEGIQWGDATIETYDAPGEYGAIPVDHTTPNRPVEIPIHAMNTDASSLNDARRVLQAWAGLVQQTHRGWLMRELGDGTRLYLDVVKATLRMGGSSLQAWDQVDSDVALVLETLPDWYGEEYVAGTTTGTGGVTLRLSGVPGNGPARVRVEIEERSGQDQRGLIYAIRPTVSDATAAMDIAATSLTPLGGATRRTGYVEYASLPPTWVATLSTRIDGVGHMTHLGTHRVWALVAASGTGDGVARSRLEWTAGGSVAPIQNGTRTLSAFPTWTDFGEVQLPRSIGSQQWEGRFLVNAPATWAYNVYRVLVLPVAYSYGLVGASPVLATGASVAAWDSFLHPAGSLDGVTAPEGGRWSGAGSGTAFQTSGTYAYRSTARDAGFRFAVLGGVSATATDVTASIATDIPNSAYIYAGLVARYVDANNYVVGTLLQLGSSGGSGHGFHITKVVGGVATDLAGMIGGGGGAALAGWHQYRLIVDAAGNVSLLVDGVIKLQAFADASLATGGALRSGAVGFRDMNAGNAASRYYDSIYMGQSVQAQDAVLYAGRVAELSTDGYARESSSGAFARLSLYGDLPRLVAGDVDVYCRLSRASFGSATSTGEAADSRAVTAHIEPVHAFLPGA